MASHESHDQDGQNPNSNSNAVKSRSPSPRAISPRMKRTKSFNEHELQLMEVITKYLILIITTDVSSIFMTIWIIIEAYLPVPTFGYMMVIIDCCVNIACIYLQFAFSKNTYMKFCGICHKRVSNIVQNSSLKRLELYTQSQTQASYQVEVDISPPTRDRLSRNASIDTGTKTRSGTGTGTGTGTASGHDDHDHDGGSGEHLQFPPPPKFMQLHTNEEIEICE